ncbi:hypothetical protein PUR_41240 [Paenibacillus sp. URB8-2]|nr:hypothetical protein PUR_41240 [Paenibacillus sp. URB8-2]
MQGMRGMRKEARDRQKGMRGWRTIPSKRGTAGLPQAKAGLRKPRFIPAGRRARSMQEREAESDCRRRKPQQSRT